VLDAWTEGFPGARLRVLAADGAELAAVAAPARIGALGVTRGEFVLVVEPDAAGSTGGYRLTVRVAPWEKGLDWEPNDTPARAQPMAALAVRGNELARLRARGTWSTAGDVDCYSVPFTVPTAGAQLRLELKPPAGIGGRLEVLDLGNAEAKVAPRTLAVATSPAAGRPAVLPTLGARSWESSYTACVSAAAGEDPAGQYTLDVRLDTAATGFEFEPNDTQETASALPLGVAVEGYLTTGDVDWFRVSAGANRMVELKLRTPVAAEVALLAPDGRELEVAQASPGRLLTLSRDGVTFVRLRATGAGDTATTYNLAASSLQGPSR
jgi:hypothetical protein